MLISEIFYSVQGEGQLTGVPSVFIRTSGCNLRCAWCDTPYASWHPEGINLTIQQILDKVLQFPAKHCVITGGEPMIARNIRELAAALHTAGFHITIETAGTISPQGIVCDLVSLSPKLANSSPSLETASAAWVTRHERTRLAPTILQQWVTQYSFQLKFVFSHPEDLAEIQAVVTSIGQPIPSSQILLMTEGTEEATMKMRQDEVLAICLQYGYRYCDRMHIRLFGNTKGT